MNGQDWYVSFGEESNIRNWDDAHLYGFVSAGGGAWFSRTIRALPVGGRVFVCIPKRGYVGVGTVSGEARPFDEATVEVDGQLRRLAELDLQGTYHHSNEAEDNEEYVVPVRWTKARPREQAIGEPKPQVLAWLQGGVLSPWRLELHGGSLGAEEPAPQPLQGCPSSAAGRSIRLIPGREIRPRVDELHCLGLHPLLQPAELGLGSGKAQQTRVSNGSGPGA
jgi:hypothetical protein